MALFLSVKEIWRNRNRFFLFSLVIALITTLVLFIAALAEGLATANKEYISKIDAELFVFQKNVSFSASASQIQRSIVNNIRRTPGIESIGSVGFGGADIVIPGGQKPLPVSLIGIEAGMPGNPAIITGKPLTTTYAMEGVLDRRAAEKLKLKVGDRITIKTIQAAKDKFYTLRVVGFSDSNQYLFRPSLFIPYRTWDEIRSQPDPGRPDRELVSNIVAVKATLGTDLKQLASQIQVNVTDVEVADKKTTIEAIPGYSAQQSTLNTQQIFTLLIGVLVIGGFFQIQMLQKVPLIGVLKAIGATNSTVALAVVSQIVIITTFGVMLGSLVTIGLALGIPSGVPIIFNGEKVITSLLALLAIGPLGGLVTVRLAVSVEPLMALGLSS